MKKICSLFLMVVMLGGLAGCDSDNGIVETNDEFVPYWWRDDPFYDDKDIDEEATNALGDPNVVLGAKMPRPPLEIMSNKITARIIEEFGEEYILHVFLHHLDKVRAWHIPGVDMDFVEEEMEPVPDVVDVYECEPCPFGTHEYCEDGGGGGGPPPPLPPPPPTFTLILEKLVCNGSGSAPDCSPRTIRYKASVNSNTWQTASVRIIGSRVDRNGYPVYQPDHILIGPLYQGYVEDSYEFFISGPLEPWQARYTGSVHYIFTPPIEELKQKQDLL